MIGTRHANGLREAVAMDGEGEWMRSSGCAEGNCPGHKGGFLVSTRPSGTLSSVSLEEGQRT